MRAGSLRGFGSAVGVSAAVGLALGLLEPAAAQSAPVEEVTSDAPAPAVLFRVAEPLALTIFADFEALDGDRRSSPERPARFVATIGSSEIELEGRVRTRGQFRLDPAHCSFPPLRLEVDARSDPTVLDALDDTKLVSSCRPGRGRYDELVILEYLAYRSYQRVADDAFGVRRLDATFFDTSGRRDPARRPAFVIEEDDALAERRGSVVFELEDGMNLPAVAFDTRALVTTAVFQYMIGNTDWSDVAGHNVEILDRGGTATVVPYDFDSSGIVSAPYATFDPDLGISSVRERVYRGWCANDFVVGVVLERFRSEREGTLALWSAEPGLSDETRRDAIRYLESFYDDIETDERARRRFLRDCRPIEAR